MQASEKQIEIMFAMQKVHLDSEQKKKQLEELPQKEQILAIRQKRQGVQEKEQQIKALCEQTTKKFHNLKDDEERKALKAAEAQEIIETAKGDYRLVQERSRELEQLTRKQAELKKSIEEVQMQQLKLEEMQKQIADALSKLDEAEAEAISSYKQEGIALQQAIAKAQSATKVFRDALPADLLQAYDKASTRGAGVAIAGLQSNRCGACRAPIDSNRLFELKRNAPLAQCPHCQRLLVVED